MTTHRRRVTTWRTLAYFVTQVEKPSRAALSHWRAYRHQRHPDDRDRRCLRRPYDNRFLTSGRFIEPELDLSGDNTGVTSHSSHREGLRKDVSLAVHPTMHLVKSKIVPRCMMSTNACALSCAVTPRDSASDRSFRRVLPGPGGFSRSRGRQTFCRRPYPKQKEDAMSSNVYAACVSQNLVRTSSFGYNERTNNLQHVLSTSVQSLPLSGMRTLSHSASYWKGEPLPSS